MECRLVRSIISCSENAGLARMPRTRIRNDECNTKDSELGPISPSSRLLSRPVDGRSLDHGQAHAILSRCHDGRVTRERDLESNGDGDDVNADPVTEISRPLIGREDNRLQPVGMH